MRYTAIARLSKDDSKGFRLYDRLDGSIIDIEYDKLKSLISSKDIYVRNLKVIKGEIKSFGGDLNDLALILNGDIVKNSLVILARVGNNFKVVDCMGKVHEVTSDVLRNLVNNKRVFNGKVRKYAGTKYSIDNKGVSFSIEKNKKLVKSVRNNKKYIGEYVSDFVPNHFLSNSVDGKIMTYTVLSMVNSESIRIDSYTGYSYNILTSKVKNDRGLHTHEGYNIFGKINKELNLNDCFEEVRELISTSDIMLKIQKSIEEYNKEIKALKIKARVDAKTGLLVSSEVKYSNIFIEARNVEVNRVDDEVVQDIIDKLRVMKVKVRVRTEYTSNDNILLYRICTKDNIKYKVYKKKIKYREIVEVSIEDIHRNISEYANAKLVDDGNIEITALDGIIKYDMNKVYEEYKVKKLDSKREKKAQLLGQDLDENINERGDLVGLYTGGNKIIIPNNVKNVLKGSIKLNSKNEELYFGNNIEKYSSLAMKNGSVNNVDKVYIDNERVKVRVNILKNIRNLRYIGSSYTININNKVDYKEFKIALDVRDSTQCREIKFNKNDNMDICNMLEKYIEEEITYKRIDNIDVEVVDTILGQKKWISSDLHNIKSLLYTSRDVVNDLGIKGDIREGLMAIIKERFKYIQKVVDNITLKEGVELM